MALSNAAAIGFGLAGAFFVDYWRGSAATEHQILGFSLVLLIGALLLGMASPLFILRMPEPLMTPVQGARPSLRQMLKEPFQDVNFRQLLNFLFFWDFATSLALPFFTVYLLVQMGLPLWMVVALNTMSQLSSVLFLRVWGPFSDRFGSKVILSLSSSLQLLVILGWAMVTLSQGSMQVLPVVAILQVFAGIASAGLTLAGSTLSIKLAPREKATAYLAVLSLVASMGAGLGPLVGGFLADLFSVHQVVIQFQWVDPSGETQFPAVRLVAYTVLFSLAFIIGLITLNALTTIREDGGASREAVLDELLSSTRQISRTIGSVPVLRLLGQFAYAYLRHIPGLDVAVGVTTYQIASTSRAAVAAVSRGRAEVLDLTEQVRHAVRSVVRPPLLKAQESRSALEAEEANRVAIQAIRGALQASNDASADIALLARGAVLGTLTALSETSLDPRDVLPATGYAAVQGASEIGADLVDTALEALDAAREMAEELGMSEEEVFAHVMQGALQAAELVGVEASDTVRTALLERGSPRN